MRSFLLALVVASAAAAVPVVKWDEAEKHLGEEVTVDGRLIGAHCTQISCILAFDPTFSRFTAVLPAKLFGDIPPDSIDRLYTGRRVQVHGKLESRDGRPQITVQEPGDLSLVHAERRQQRDAEKMLRNQTEILDRLSNVVERLADVTERMAATQERMDALLAQMEQREVALAQAIAANQPPPPPPPPSGGEPQPRPGFEALRTIKRGMSTRDVARLVGQPSYVENSGGGWTTWYYGYGRSVSFDGRGRVQSLVGFPAP